MEEREQKGNGGRMGQGGTPGEKVKGHTFRWIYKRRKKGNEMINI